MAPELSCLIVDEHPVVRQGIRALLERELPGAERVRPAEREPALEPARDPVTEAIRLVEAVAGAGLKVASGVLRRLPRP